ncbi:rab-GTPase-TBC domain-containing protein [Chlamydoabsidia padenii]|nr:rab-GTPase-TBC domain-containing protein [Chlamydoabsidia padenii]
MNLFSRQRNTMKPSPLETVVSKTRPRMLPPKDPNEEKKHLQQHDAMMKKALQLEIKKQKEHDKKKEEINKKVTHSVNVWEKTILPHWNKKIKEKKVQELWLQGIPPRCRRKVWILAIGNNLGLSKESFSTCARRLPSVNRPNQDSKPTKYSQESRTSTRRRIAENNTLHHSYDDDPAHQDMAINTTDDDPTFYQQLNGRRTSSLNVLNDQDDDDDDYNEDSGKEGYSNKFDDEPLTPQSTTSSTTHSIGYVDNNNNSSKTSQHSDQANELQGDTISDIVDGGAMTSSDRESIDSQDSIKIGDDDDDDNSNDIAQSNSNNNNNDDDDDNPIYDTSTIAFLHKAVDEDIVRTLPSLCVFQPDGPLFLSLRKVLHAYIGYRSDLNYTRGASFLAGMLLLNLGTHDTFVALTNLIHNSPVLSALYNSDEARVKGYFKIFNVIFAEHMPKLYLHFKNLSLTPDNYLSDWLMTLFSSITPLSVSSRLWDIFLLEGDVILFKTGLVVLKYLEPLLWGGGFSETVRILNMGFIGEHRGEEAKAAVAVSGGITKGEQDQFFHDILGNIGKSNSSSSSSSNMIHLDSIKYATLVKTHIQK